MAIVVLHVRIDAFICAGHLHHRLDVLAPSTETKQELKVSDQRENQSVKGTNLSTLSSMNYVLDALMLYTFENGAITMYVSLFPSFMIIRS